MLNSGDKMIKTITFDFGGVLYDYDGDRLMNELASHSGHKPKAFEEKLRGSALDRAHFRGEIEADELVEILSEKVGLTMTVDQLAEAYENSVNPNEEIFELVKQLNKNYNLQLYSDTPKILYDRVIKKMPVIDYFGEVTLSFEVGELKDSPRGYEEVISKSSHSPEEIIFIDDRGEFVEQAKELGINGIKFTNINNLIEELNKLGVELDGQFDLKQEEK